VDGGYFTTMRVPVMAGRGIAEADRAGGLPAVVVNQTLAQRLWPNENPLGKRIRSEGNELEVVGVARDGKYLHVGESPNAFMFRSFDQHFQLMMSIHVRAQPGAAQILDRIRQELWALDPNVALNRPSPLSARLGTFSWRSAMARHSSDCSA
jgi:hypothetical protein